MKQRNCRFNGDGLVLVIILLAVIGIGAIWLYSHKKSLDRDVRTFGREAIQQLAVNHNKEFLTNYFSPQAKLENPPSQQDHIIEVLTAKGVPQQPINIEEVVTFESHFFDPKGYFTAHLNYPSGPATMQVAVSHPVAKWQLDNMTYTVEQAPR